jgi:hypothetical protein
MAQSVEWPPEWMTVGTRTKIEAMVAKGDTGRAALEVMHAHKEAQRLRELPLQMAGQIVKAAQAAMQKARNTAKGRWKP